MNSMEVELLNAIKYVTKDNRQRTLIHFRALGDNLSSNTDKFKGYAILDGYFDGYDVFEKIPSNYYGCKVTLYYEKKPLANDPFKEVTKIVKLNDINLV